MARGFWFSCEPFFASRTSIESWYSLCIKIDGFACHKVEKCLGLRHCYIFDTGKRMKRLFLTIILLFLLMSASTTIAQNSIAVTPSNSRPGAASIYELSFVTTDTMKSDARIAITFPANFDLSLLRMANSTNINGGFKVQENQKPLAIVSQKRSQQDQPWKWKKGYGVFYDCFRAYGRPSTSTLSKSYGCGLQEVL